MRTTIIWLGLTALTAALSTGCATAPTSTEPTLARVTAQDATDYEHLWSSVGDTLREQSFRIDRRDRLNGVVSTFPETTAQAFELWRPQPETLETWLEANLQTVQRAVQVTIQPTEATGEYTLAVQVDTSRYSLPERQIDNSAGALRLYSADAPTESGRTESPSKTAQMIPLGRDKPAEERLLKLILDRFARPPAVAATTQPSA